MATYFWVGGTGTWNATSSTMWSTTSGVTGTPAGPPQAGDTATFDNNSSAAVVTVGTSINSNNNVLSIVCGQFPGTLDFSVNNLTITSSVESGTSFSFTGTGARTIKCGTSTFNIANGGTYDLGTTTNLNANSSFSGLTLICAGSTRTGAIGQQNIASGGQAHGTITINASMRLVQGVLLSLSGTTIGTLNLNAGPYPLFTQYNAGAAATITSINMTGNSSAYVSFGIFTSQATTQTINLTSGSFDRGIFHGLVLSPATFTATNSYDTGNNNMGTITPPTATGAAGIIGS